MPPQVVKINQHDASPASSSSSEHGTQDQNSLSPASNSYPSVSPTHSSDHHSDPLIEELPKPEAQRSLTSSDYKTTFGLPGYNGPEDFAPRRGTTAADYSAPGSGFVPSEPFATKQSKYTAPTYDNLDRYGTFKSSASEFIPTTYQNSPEDHFGSRRYNRPNQQQQQQDSRGYSHSRPYSTPTGLVHADYSGYLRASSEAQSSIATGPSPQHQQIQPQENYGSMQSRRKPFDQDVQSSNSGSHQQQGPYDQSFPQSKHYMSTEVIRDQSGGDLFADGQASHSMEQTVSATNDNELAQLAATMSEFSSSPTSTPDFGMSGSDSMGLSDGSGFGSLGSASMLGSHPFHAGSMPAPSAVPGEKLSLLLFCRIICIPVSFLPLYH